LQIIAVGIESLFVPPSPAFDVVALGLNAADTIVRLPHFPSLDSKVEILSTSASLGGQAASAAYACQRWGLRTRYIGKIGDDRAGQLHREQLSIAGVETRLFKVPDCESQFAYILVDASSGERTILWKRDPRLNIDPMELRREWFADTRLLHVDGHPSAPSIVAARWAKDAGAIVTADLDNVYSEVQALLEYVDYLISSREFPQRLTGISDLTQSLPAISALYHCRVAGATLGCGGVIAWDGQAFHYCPAFVVDAVDTTGAGDIFHAGFAYALLRSDPLPRALEFGCAAAALNCTALGARGGIRPVAEIEELMHVGKRHAAAFSEEDLRTRPQPPGAQAGGA
jgi:sugar/nucleoside kinase (ribokinase family)